jgi:hypothetical protein
MNLSGSTKSLAPQVVTYKINSIVWMDSSLSINKFKIKIGFHVLNENPILNEIAIDQIDIFFKLLVENSIFMDKTTYDAMENPPSNNIFLTLDKADDQSIVSMIFLKLHSIVKNNLDIEFVSLSSKLGNNIRYSVDGESELPDIMLPKKAEWWGDEKIKFDPWWLRSDTATYDKLINDEEIYEGEFLWGELFKDEFSEAAKLTLPSKEKFKLIPGGKNDN